MFEPEDTKPGLSTAFAIEQGLRAAAEINEDQLARVSPELREAFSSAALALLYVADLVHRDVNAKDEAPDPTPEDFTDPRRRWENTAVEQLKRAVAALERASGGDGVSSRASD
jgi:hypothetical protein